MALGTPTPKKKSTMVYVLSQEHYHFPPNESDMVASTPLSVRGKLAEGKILAKKLAEEHYRRFGGEVKEHTSGTKEYRVWVDPIDPRSDMARFVWVVRETKYEG